MIRRLPELRIFLFVGAYMAPRLSNDSLKIVKGFNFISIFLGMDPFLGPHMKSGSPPVFGGTHLCLDPSSTKTPVPTFYQSKPSLPVLVQLPLNLNSERAARP